MRTSKKQVQGIFEVFVKAIHGHVAKDYKDVGGYRLQYHFNQGYSIEQIYNEQGGITEPFGSTIRKAEEMWYTLYFAMDVIRVLKGK